MAVLQARGASRYHALRTLIYPSLSHLPRDRVVTVEYYNIVLVNNKVICDKMFLIHLRGRGT